MIPGIKKLLSRDQPPEHLPADVQAGLAAWRESAPPPLDEVHFHTRYLVVDIARSGAGPDDGRLLGIAAAAVRHAVIDPGEALYAAFDAAADAPGALERKLLAFLLHAAKAPLVTYHAPLVGACLARACKEALGIDFQPQWIDLAWLLPAMYDDMSSAVQPLDHWLAALGLDPGGGRRDAAANALLLARLFQMLLARARSRGIHSPARLIAEANASSVLRRVS